MCLGRLCEASLRPRARRTGSVKLHDNILLMRSRGCLLRIRSNQIGRRVISMHSVKRCAGQRQTFMAPVCVGTVRHASGWGYHRRFSWVQLSARVEGLVQPRQAGPTGRRPKRNPSANTTPNTYRMHGNMQPKPRAQIMRDLIGSCSLDEWSWYLLRQLWVSCAAPLSSSYAQPKEPKSTAVMVPVRRTLGVAGPGTSRKPHMLSVTRDTDIRRYAALHAECCTRHKVSTVPCMTAILAACPLVVH